MRGQPTLETKTAPVGATLYGAKCSREVARLEDHWTVLVRRDTRAKRVLGSPVLPAGSPPGKQLQPLKMTLVLTQHLPPVEQDEPQELTRVAVTVCLGKGGTGLNQQALCLCLQASERWKSSLVCRA